MSDRPNYIKPNHRGDRANHTRTIAVFGWLRTIDTEIVELCRIIYKEAGANYMLTGSATEKLMQDRRVVHRVNYVRTI